MLDAWLVPFLTTNPASLLLLVGVLKILANEAKWATGNKILELFTGLIPGKK